MTRGTISLKVVHDRLGLVESGLRDLRALPVDSFETFLEDFRNAAAAESLLRRTIEALLDTARHLLAKQFGEGTLEYKKVAQLAVEHGLVLDPETGKRFVLIAGYRNRLTHFYDQVTPEELYGILREELGDLESIVAELRAAAGRISGMGR
ncbi:MAG TPA: DUF86 domain-containing protein [Thermoanaerobaculia bacterium]|nr:DUF86 domain-containing protein [Thermoanaerobaculia bacterium]